MNTMTVNSTLFLAGPASQNLHHGDEVDSIVMTKAEANVGWSGCSKLLAKQKTKTRKQHRSNKKALLQVFDVNSDDEFISYDSEV